MNEASEEATMDWNEFGRMMRDVRDMAVCKGRGWGESGLGCCVAGDDPEDVVFEILGRMRGMLDEQAVREINAGFAA